MNAPAEELPGVEELRRAVRLFDGCNESFNWPATRHVWTAEELVNIARACWASGWDVWPDQWPPVLARIAARKGADAARQVDRWCEAADKAGQL